MSNKAGSIERKFLAREADELEHIETEEELTEYLDIVAPHIGWIIIYFNSLEDHITDFIREAILRDPLQDERLDVFLAEMSFASKCKALIHLYGQIIQSQQVKHTQQDLSNLENQLNECSKRRNEYAHADWIGARKESYVKVKSQSQKQGIIHRYKKIELLQIQEDVDYINDARFFLDDFNETLYNQFFARE